MKKQPGSPGDGGFPAFALASAAVVLGLLGVTWLVLPALGAGARTATTSATSSRPRSVAWPLAPLPPLQPNRAVPLASARSTAIAPSASSASADAAPPLASALPSAALAPSAVTSWTAPAFTTEQGPRQEPVARVLWQHRGLCSDDAATAEGSQRARYLADFASGIACTDDSSSDFALAPGITAMLFLPGFGLSLDARYDLVFAE